MAQWNVAFFSFVLVYRRNNHFSTFYPYIYHNLKCFIILEDDYTVRTKKNYAFAVKLTPVLAI